MKVESKRHPGWMLDVEAGRVIAPHQVEYELTDGMLTETHVPYPADLAAELRELKTEKEWALPDGWEWYGHAYGWAAKHSLTNSRVWPYDGRVESTARLSGIASAQQVTAIVAIRNGLAVPEWARDDRDGTIAALAAALEKERARVAELESRLAPIADLTPDTIQNLTRAEMIGLLRRVCGATKPESPWPLRFSLGTCNFEITEKSILGGAIKDVKEAALAVASIADADPKYAAWREQHETTCEAMVRGMIDDSDCGSRCKGCDGCDDDNWSPKP